MSTLDDPKVADEWGQVITLTVCSNFYLYCLYLSYKFEPFWGDGGRSLRISLNGFCLGPTADCSGLLLALCAGTTPGGFWVLGTESRWPVCGAGAVPAVLSLALPVPFLKLDLPRHFNI